MLFLRSILSALTSSVGVEIGSASPKSSRILASASEACLGLPVDMRELTLSNLANFMAAINYNSTHLHFNFRHHSYTSRSKLVGIVVIDRSLVGFLLEDQLLTDLDVPACNGEEFAAEVVLDVAVSFHGIWLFIVVGVGE